MGNIKADVDQDRGITTFTATGKISVQEIINELEIFYSHPSTLLVLWDFSAAEPVDMTTIGLMRILTSSKERGKTAKKGKRAIVVSGDFAFGMGRMYEIFAEIYGHPNVHKIFRSKDEAIQWLTGDT